MPKVKGELGPLERTVMDHVWKQGTDVTVRDVLGSGVCGDVAYITVMTILDRLCGARSSFRVPDPAVRIATGSRAADRTPIGDKRCSCVS